MSFKLYANSISFGEIISEKAQSHLAVASVTKVAQGI